MWTNDHMHCCHCNRCTEPDNPYGYDPSETEPDPERDFPPEEEEEFPDEPNWKDTTPPWAQNPVDYDYQDPEWEKDKDYE